MSCILLGLSFMTYLIPLAAFQLGQLASLKRPGAALALLASVGVGSAFLGLVFQVPVLFFAAFCVLLWAPFLLPLVWLRVSCQHKHWSLAVGLLPVALLSIFLMSLPVVPDVVSFLETYFQSAQGALPPQWSKEFSQTASQVLILIKSSVLPELYALSPWQRLVWVTIGNGQPWFLSLMAIAIGNVVLTDLGARNVERIWAIAHAVVNNPQVFSQEAINTCLAICHNAPQSINTHPAHVVKDRLGSLGVPHTPRMSILTELPGKSIQIWPPFKPRPPWPPSERAWGGVFSFPSENSWFWEFSKLPFALCFGAVAWLASLLYWSSSVATGGLPATGSIQATVVAWVSQKPPMVQGALGVATWFSFSALCLLAAQGCAVLYVRLVKWALFALVLAGLIASSKGLLPPAGFVGILAAVGFLDEIMGWRVPQLPGKTKSVLR